MRILSNMLAFSIFIISLGVILYVFLPKLEGSLLLQSFQKKDVPMPTMLHPKVEEYKNNLIASSKERGIDIVITEGHRSMERQNELYDRGRSTDGDIVTYAEGGESYHNYGLAIDFALRLENGNVVWDMNRDGNGNGEADWLEVVSLAKDMGFEWGGDFSNFKDYPHFQMDFGLSIRELQFGKRPKVDQYAEK
ncbi:M15 family metallopeptidase [Halobacillus sp. BBL2006]|uniref:M15 family metallopeptidase n=1 Tax=Halobacillus sp. BBL2006 TaxID=1543706 RepID=UPI0009DCE928|nr:M15 family metallopeptidase [Halobacillus sp. BBL2006]